MEPEEIEQYFWSVERKELSIKNSIASKSISRNKSEIKTFSLRWKKHIKEFAVNRLPLKELLELIFKQKWMIRRGNLEHQE